MQSSSVVLLSLSCYSRAVLLSDTCAPRTQLWHRGWQFPCFAGMSLVLGTGCFRRNNCVGSHPSLAVQGLYLVQGNLLPGEDLQQNKSVCSCPRLGMAKCGWSVCSMHWGLKRHWFYAGNERLWTPRSLFFFSLRPPASFHVDHRCLFGIVKKWCRRKSFLNVIVMLQYFGSHISCQKKRA